MLFSETDNPVGIKQEKTTAFNMEISELNAIIQRFGSKQPYFPLRKIVCSITRTTIFNTDGIFMAGTMEAC